jgi:hypothetical protein
MASQAPPVVRPPDNKKPIHCLDQARGPAVPKRWLVLLPAARTVIRQGHERTGGRTRSQEEAPDAARPAPDRRRDALQSHEAGPAGRLCLDFGFQRWHPRKEQGASVGQWAGRGRGAFSANSACGSRETSYYLRWLAAPYKARSASRRRRAKPDQPADYRLQTTGHRLTARGDRVPCARWREPAKGPGVSGWKA